MKEILPLSSDDFSLFRALLLEESGLQFEKDRNLPLHLALWERIQQRGYESYREYYHLLKFHPEGRLEMKELLDLITIGETYFFRNKAQFQVLMRFVLPELIQRKSGSMEKSLRVWSAGCSRGDEPYSLAIAIMEVLPSYRDWNISILGTDVNRNGLSCAKEGVYCEKDIGHLPMEYLEKYFKVGGTAYHLHSDVKGLVQFEYHNLVRDPLAQGKMQDLDLVFCRNVTIYFEGQRTCRVIDRIHDCLAPGGYLFLGHTETLWHISDKFESVEYPQAFVYRKRLDFDPGLAVEPAMAVTAWNTEEGIRSPVSSLSCEDGGDRGSVFQPGQDTGPAIRAAASRVRPLGGVLLRTMALQEGNSIVTESPGFGGRMEDSVDQVFQPRADNGTPQGGNGVLDLLDHATTLANRARYKEAAEVLARVVQTDNLSVEAYYLLGTLCYQGGDLKGAEAHFRKVIYVTPDSALAYFNLGNVYLSQKKLDEAAREFRNALRLSENRPKEEQVRFGEEVSVECLLRACRNSLAEISKRGG